MRCLITSVTASMRRIRKIIKPRDASRGLMVRSVSVVLFCGNDRLGYFAKVLAVEA